MFKIGDFSKLSFVSIRMLRYYDEIGLFKPVRIDDFTNYRYYSAKQIPRLNMIVGLRNLGLKSEEIKLIIDENNNKKQIELLRSKKQEIVRQIHDDEQRLTKLERFIQNYNKEERYLKYEAVVKSVPSYKVIALKAVMPTFNSEGELWGKLMEIVGKHNLFSKFVQGGMCYAMFFEEDDEEGKIHIEIGSEVHSLGENVEGTEFRELKPINEALSVLVAGPYEPNIQEGYNYVATWLEDNSYSISGPTRTVYIKGPDAEKNPDNYLTEILVPIKKK